MPQWIKVTGCVDCPMASTDSRLFATTCTHPDTDGFPYVGGGAAPGWCPLRVRTLVVQFKK